MKVKKRGFSLLELTLVLGVGAMVGFMKFQGMKNEQESMIAQAVGSQIRQVGEATNRYISIRYDKLSTLTSSSSQSSDPGPRTCSNLGCEITYQTLVSEGLLPSSYNGINANKSSYKILLKRDGLTPNYVINGLVTTSDSWKEDNKIRYDLLGKAMQAAGIDSGMTKNTTVVSGYQGQWSERNSDYSNIISEGLLAYRVGYDSSMYSVYLRRDGTLPMTGNLNMGTNDIYNAKDITASGSGVFGGNMGLNGFSASDFPSGWKGGLRANNVLAGGTIATGTSDNIKSYINNLGDVYGERTVTSGGKIIAHNNSNDSITIGGDSNDYKIQLDNGNKILNITSPNSSNYTTILSVNRNMVVNQRLSTMGFDPNDLPEGWAGGVRTWDVLAGGTIGVLKKDKKGTDITASDQSGWAFYTDLNGSVYASGNMQVDKTINASGNIHAYGDITSTKRLTSGEYLQILGVANIGESCNSNGLQARTVNGQLISCVDAVWKTTNVSTNIRSGDFGSVNNNKNASGTTSCQNNEKIISGGATCHSSKGVGFLMTSQPSGNNGWYGLCGDTGGSLTGVTVWAMCM